MICSRLSTAQGPRSDDLPAAELDFYPFAADLGSPDTYHAGLGLEGPVCQLVALHYRDQPVDARHQLQRDPAEQPLVSYDSDDGPLGALRYVDAKAGPFEHIGNLFDFRLLCAWSHYDDHAIFSRPAVFRYWPLRLRTGPYVGLLIGLCIRPRTDQRNGLRNTLRTPAYVASHSPSPGLQYASHSPSRRLAQYASHSPSRWLVQYASHPYAVLIFRSSVLPFFCFLVLPFYALWPVLLRELPHPESSGIPGHAGSGPRGAILILMYNDMI